ncbi:MAG: 1-acylglycerol-3-phosphate O-acyltransferase [Glaciecola sp.]
MLAILRFVVLLGYFIVINALLLIAFIVRPLHRNNVNLAGKVYSTMAYIVGIKLVYRNSSKVDPNQSYVFVANHQNSYDLLTISHAAGPGVVTMGKKSLKWIPIFGLIYWLSGNIMIDRKNSGRARDTLAMTGEKMKERNLSIWIFPEGTRSRGRGMLPFKTGAFRLASSLNKQIVPVVCSELNNGRIKFNRWNNGTVIIETLDPVSIDVNENAKHMATRFHDIMQATFERISDEAAHLSKAK